MRILLLADIHANWPALQALDEPHDVCLCLGDLVDYALPDTEFWARRLQHVDADVVCVGHTHQPYVLPVGDKLVINPGSIGQPRDGDPRAAYAVIDNNEVQ